MQAPPFISDIFGYTLSVILLKIIKSNDKNGVDRGKTSKITLEIIVRDADHALVSTLAAGAKYKIPAPITKQAAVSP